MNREQIIKALECCIEVNCGSIAVCPYREKFKNCFECQANLKKEALALINELTEENKGLFARNLDLAEKGEKVVIAYKKLSEENERLKETVKVRGETIEDLQLLIRKVEEENERLHASCTELTQCCTKLETLYKVECKRVDTVKADTVKKMQERLKEKLEHYPQRCGDCFKEKVDQIAKEMLEVAKRCEDIEKSPVDCSTPSVTDSKGEKDND